jgi:propionyl-CoA carboxylase alpha chain
VRLPGSAPAETYLRGELMIRAALAAGADAVHPGYGFLSENAEFAQAVLDAGLTWIGPPVKVIELMGSKVTAKRLMGDAGVPVLAELPAASVTESDLPVLVKAATGGGGRGMRVVRSLASLPGALADAQREARSAFGDPTVFIERFVEVGRHIEVQVLGDRHGTVWALGERECSIQRRHQKVIEEAPSPLVSRTPGMREPLYAAATAAARAIGYEGAGTVEFLARDDGGFFFLEMNTRLQVEHPVTECTTGLDLVRLQLEVAEGSALTGLLREPPVARGHSIEARLYAEDPSRDWQPSSGVVHRLSVPGTAASFAPLGTPGVRLDSGVTDGSAVGVNYDGLLAKVISFGASRGEAARLLASALAGAEVHGLTTNRDLLVRVLRHPAFLAGDTSTGFFAAHGLDSLARPLASPSAVSLSAVAAALADAAANRRGAAVLGGLPSGWRNVPSLPQVKRFGLVGGASDVEVRYRFGRDGVTVGHDGLSVVSVAPDLVVLDVPCDVGVVRRRFSVARYGSLVCVDSVLGAVSLVQRARFADPLAAVSAGSLLAPIPGTVIRVAARVGEQVTAGQPIVVLEAMKMEHLIAAPAAGVVTALDVAVGQVVGVGTVLAVVEEALPVSFIETDVQRELRASVARLGQRFGYTSYVLPKARAGEPLTELWNEAGKLGFLGVNLPEEYGGGGAGIYELALVEEELAAQGAGLLLLVVSPAICGTILARYGTERQRQQWLPGLADGSKIMAFGITEPDAGSNSHEITTTARRSDSGGWILTGRKVFISGVDQADAVLIVARVLRTGKLRPALFIVPTGAENFVAQPMDMDFVAPDRQFTLFFDDVRLPAEALVGAEDAALEQLFAGLNPERILGAAMAVGMGRYALSSAASYARTRQVWRTPIGAHQGIAHPLAQIKIELELAKLMMQKAAVLYDSGDDMGAGEAANMAKYAAAEASIRALEQAIQTHGGSGLTAEHGLATMLATARITRIAPVSREMILNFVAEHSLGLPKSY